MSDTPRTDAAIRAAQGKWTFQLRDQMKQMEVELNAANTELARLRSGGCARDQLAARVADADRERDQALAVLGAYKMDKDALAARVKELEPYEAICKNPAALWANWLRGTVVLPAGIGDVRQEQARVKELEAYAERLEQAGDGMHQYLMDEYGTQHVICMIHWREEKGRTA